MSLRHLRQAARLGGSAEALAVRLYGAGAALPTCDVVRSIAAPSADPSMVRSVVVAATGWRCASSAADGWTHCTTNGAAPLGGGITHKLYVSPVATERADLLPVIAGALSSGGIIQFKVGKGRSGWLRSDWLVAYSDSFGSLRLAADRVAKACAGARWVGVPFTSEVGHGPGLSAGLDPPVRSAAPMSWRLFVCLTLARALADGQDLAPPRSESAVDLAVLRALSVATGHGIDTQSWRPTQHLIDRWAATADDGSDGMPPMATAGARNT